MNYGAHSIDKILYTTGLSVTDVHAVMQNFLNSYNVELSAQVLLKLESEVGAVLMYSGNKTSYTCETEFYFTEGVIKAQNGVRMEIWRNSEKVSEKDFGNCNVIELQLREFVKLLKNENSNIVTADYGKYVISILEKIYK